MTGESRSHLGGKIQTWNRKGGSRGGGEAEKRWLVWEKEVNPWILLWIFVHLYWENKKGGCFGLGSPPGLLWIVNTHTQNRVFHLVFCDLCKPYFETLHIFPINWVICRISKLHLVKVWCQKHPLRDLDHTLRDVSFVRHDLDIKRKIWRKQRRPMGPMDRWRFPHVRIHGIHGDPWEPWEPNLYAIYIPYKKVKCSWIGKCTPYI